MIRCLIVEDEEHCINTLKQLINRYNSILPCRVIAEVSSCADAIDAINTLKPSLVFLDIELSDGSSLEIFSQLQHHDFKTIFTTAFDQFALQAIRLSALDYLLKPIDDDEFKRVLNKVGPLPFTAARQVANAIDVYQNTDHIQKHQIAVRKNDDIYFLKIQDILAFKAKGAYTEIISQNNPIHVSSKNLKYFEDIVHSYLSFFRIHHATIVNLDYLKKLHYPKNSNNAYVILTDGASHEVSSRKLAQLKEQLGL